MDAAVVVTWIWLIFEIGLALRDRARGKGATARDRGTRTVIMILVAVSIVVANVVAIALPAGSDLRFDESGPVVWQVIGVALMLLGLAVRIWAIAVLGSAFRTTVEVDPDQAVVDRGPYHWVRHPSYSGVLQLTIGFGIAAGNWISLLLVTIVPALAFLRRIVVEEKAMVETLGRAYEQYRARTRRLVPGVW
ncbi:methyltransferase family protein [Nocardia vermiculata]|uniref:Isoprenylcysteine carboxylmethyltransferase family protein n=1 Tax=Nocardia vermiculata TaxID=257274 RepID=A0A846Y1R4_9NOCA|nr:isoprenylcysteine carboxylmethyltransferase family protein [Nocardia vermiculata]NKY52115.1 isoprenylcysteine carboxylmethyltransferase family protein [Nocardia vermiculata]